MQGSEIVYQISHQAYVIAALGSFILIHGKQTVNMSKGDGAEITQTQLITINALKNSEILIIDVP